MTATVDHLVYVCPELGPAVRHVAETLGVQPEYGGQHPGLGTHNALLALGSRTYLEIIAADPAQPEPSEPLPFGLSDLAGPALHAWAAAPDDLDGAIARSLAAGYDYGPVVSGRRRTADGRDLTWRMTTSAHHEGIGVAPFLIDWGSGAHPAQGAPAGAVLADFSLSVPDPQPLTERLAVLGVAVRVGAGSQPGLRAVITGPGGARLELSS